MKPAVKYAALTALHSVWPQAVWEQSIFQLLDQHYRRKELAGLREELVGLRTLGWLEVVEEAEFEGQLLHRYRLFEPYTDTIARQISVERISRFLDGRNVSAERNVATGRDGKGTRI